ncbi:GNAT family N-acetyltransferase [Arthrobacter tecti]
MATIAIANASDFEFERVLALYESVGWRAYTEEPEKLRAALLGSSLLVAATQGSELVGLARAISDNASICYLQDVLVCPSHQRLGIGKNLVTAALEQYPHVRQKVLLTDDEPKQKAFYESLGYAETGDFNGGALRAFVRFD